jgi:ABC transporter substrate binding protein
VIASLRRNDLLRSDDNALALRRQTLSRSPSRIAASRRSALIFDTSDHSAAFTRIGEALAALPVDSTVLDGEAIFCASPPKRNRAYSSVTQLPASGIRNETRKRFAERLLRDGDGTGRRCHCLRRFADFCQYEGDRRWRARAAAPFDWIPRSCGSGGLIGCGVDLTKTFRRAAIFIDKILKGAKPSELPIEQPIKFKLVLNLKTAKLLGLTLPSTLLARADDVIE